MNFTCIVSTLVTFLSNVAILPYTPGCEFDSTIFSGFHIPFPTLDMYFGRGITHLIWLHFLTYSVSHWDISLFPLPNSKLWIKITHPLMGRVEQSQVYPSPISFDGLYNSKEGKLVHLEDRTILERGKGHV